MVLEMILRYIPKTACSLDEFRELACGETCVERCTRPTNTSVLRACFGQFSPVSYIIYRSRTAEGRKIVYEEALPANLAPAYAKK